MNKTKQARMQHGEYKITEFSESDSSLGNDEDYGSDCDESRSRSTSPTRGEDDSDKVITRLEQQLAKAKVKKFVRQAKVMQETASSDNSIGISDKHPNPQKRTKQDQKEDMKGFETEKQPPANNGKHPKSTARKGIMEQKQELMVKYNQTFSAYWKSLFVPITAPS
eukprot:gene7237-12919_t